MQVLSRFIISLVLVCFCVVGCVTGTPPETQKKIFEPQSRVLPWLWEAQSSKSPYPIWLLGTIHAGISLQSYPALLEYLHKSQVVVVEVDLSQEKRIGELFAAKMRGECGKVKKVFWEKEWQELVAFLRVSEEFASCLSPVGLGMIYLSRVQKMCKACEANAALDHEILGKAKELNKDLMFLETPEEQLQYLERTFTLETIKRDLRVENVSTMYDSLLAAYRAQDAQRIVALLKEDSAWFGLEERNKNWLSKIKTCAKSGPCLVVVGLAHLLDNENERSVLQFLRDEGFVVRRL